MKMEIEIEIDGDIQIHAHIDGLIRVAYRLSSS